MTILTSDVIIKNWSNWSELNQFNYPILNGVEFNGSYESTNTYRYIIVNLKSSNKLHLKISQSNDGIITNKENSYIIDHLINNNAVILLLDYKYYKTDVSIFEGEPDATYTLMTSKLSNDQDINITVKGDKKIALNQDNSGLLNVNINSGNLNVISGMRGTFEGNIIPIACDSLGNLKSNITIENIQLSPVTDGIKIFGSSDMIDNIVMKVDAGGKLQNHDTELNASVLISNDKLESIEGKLDADNGVLISRDKRCY